MELFYQVSVSQAECGVRAHCSTVALSCKGKMGGWQRDRDGWPFGRMTTQKPQMQTFLNQILDNAACRTRMQILSISNVG
jgi:hypothetical protein